MQKIYSKINPKQLLHIVVKKEDITPGRINLVEPTNFIQCSSLNLSNGTTFKPHKHIWKEQTRNVIAQESWIVIQGSVECIFYDIDDTILTRQILFPGDCSFTLEGGHNYLILEDNTLVYEYKTGPYTGQSNDKRFINE